MHSSWNAHVTNEDVCKQARERNEEWQEQGFFYFACFMDVNKDICLELGKKNNFKNTENYILLTQSIWKVRWGRINGIYSYV